jgi:hypothetical protein
LPTAYCRAFKGLSTDEDDGDDDDDDEDNDDDDDDALFPLRGVDVFDDDDDADDGDADDDVGADRPVRSSDTNTDFIVSVVVVPSFVCLNSR